MSFQQPCRPASLSDEIARWLVQTPDWYLQAAPADDGGFSAFGYAPSYRHATAEEVSAKIVSSPALREALGFLTSPAGQAIEEAVARLWLPGWQAALLTDALTLAWKTVLNQDRPVWQRTEVLIGALLLIGLIGIFLWGGRN